MNGVLWSVKVKHGFEHVFARVIQEEMNEYDISCQIYDSNDQGKELVILIALSNEQERKLFENSDPFLFMKHLIHRMCLFAECSSANC